jgi:hypothetical protein
MLGCADAAFAYAGFKLHLQISRRESSLEYELWAALGDAAYEELPVQGSRMDPYEMLITPEALEGAVS